jgi:hypothetical protein
MISWRNYWLTFIFLILFLMIIEAITQTELKKLSCGEMRSLTSIIGSLWLFVSALICFIFKYPDINLIVDENGNIIDSYKTQQGIEYPPNKFWSEIYLFSLWFSVFLIVAVNLPEILGIYFFINEKCLEIHFLLLGVWVLLGIIILVFKMVDKLAKILKSDKSEDS